MTDRPISALYAAIIAYAEATGASNINELPGCWEAELPDKTFVAINAHRESLSASRGPKLSPYYAYVEVRGLPAALIDPFDGMTMISADDLIARFESARKALA